MDRRFLKNIVFLLFVNLLIKPFWILGVDRAVQVGVGDAAYGSYLALFNFAYLFYIVLDIGLTNFNNRNIAQYPHLLAKHFAGISQAKVFLSVVYFAIIFTVGLLIGYRGEQLKLLALVGLNQVLLSFILYVRSNISALLLFKTDSILSILDRLLMILICGFMLWSGIFPRSSFNIYWFVYAQTASYVVTLILAVAVVLRHTGRLTLKLNVPFVLMIIKKSLPYAMLVLLMSFYSRLEPVLIERILPDDIAAQQTGIYARAYRLFDAGNNISYLFSVILLPLFAAMIKQNESLQSLVKQSFGLMVAMTGVVAVNCMFFSGDIMRLMYPESSSEEASVILMILMGSFVSISVTYIFGTLLTANGNLRYLNIVSGIGVVVNIMLNMLFIPHFMAVGAAFTSLCVQSVICVAEYLIAKKVFKLSFGMSFWVRMAVFFIISVVAVWILKQNITNVLSAAGISILTTIIIAFVTKLIDYKELLVLAKTSLQQIKAKSRNKVHVNENNS